MAKQVGPIFLEDTIGDIIFYKRDGKYYIRMKPCFPDIKRSPRFRGTMKSANRMGRASKIGAALYATLPEALKQFPRYRALTGEAFHMLKAGNTEEETMQTLKAQQENLLANSEKMAAAVYKALGEHFKQSWMYWAFVEEAMEMMKEEKTPGEIYTIMWNRYAAEFEPGYTEEKEFRHELAVKITQMSLIDTILKRKELRKNNTFSKRPAAAFSSAGLACILLFCSLGQIILQGYG